MNEFGTLFSKLTPSIQLAPQGKDSNIAVCNTSYTIYDTVSFNDLIKAAVYCQILASSLWFGDKAYQCCNINFHSVTLCYKISPRVSRYTDNRFLSTLIHASRLLQSYSYYTVSKQGGTKLITSAVYLLYTQDSKLLLFALNIRFSRKRAEHSL